MKSIKQRLQAGEEVRVALVGVLASPKLIEIFGKFGNFHPLWIDQEHCGIPQPQLELLMIACRAAGIEGFVRVPPLDYCTIMRPMEAGASGVMVAQIRDMQQVRQIVDWAKYPPDGVRGMFRANYEVGYGTADLAQHVTTTNQDRWLAIQIETPEAVACIDDILTTDGVDTVFVGPADLSVTLGLAGQPMHPKCIDALQHISAAEKKAEKSWGVLPLSLEHADLCRSLGYQMFSLVSDIESVRLGLAAARETYAAYLPSP